MKALGREHLLVGGMMEDDAAKAAPFDLRYLYIAGGAQFPGGAQAPPPACPEKDAGPWWGCWQWHQDPPGQYVRGFLARTKALGQVPMITWYQWLHTSGVEDGTDEIGALKDLPRLRRYLADWRFLLKQVGDAQALLHLEPDLWGYAQHVSEDPATLPAPVSKAAPEECGDVPDTVAGLARCMVRMAQVHAPNSKVGLHASFWATKVDVSINRDPALDVADHAQRVGRYLLALGAAQTDFIAIGATDRDAGYYQHVRGQDRWWDPENRALPNFRQAFHWAKEVSETARLPNLWWQLPLGHPALPDKPNGWRDNRVDYFLQHPEEVVAAHGFALAFGAGMKGMTTPSTDRGNFLQRARRHLSSTRPLICP